MGNMKRIVCILACAAAALSGADLSSVRTVYVMPMSHAMDQYLASRLTVERLFTVVSDPKLADAVFTDHLGAGLEASLDEIAPSESPAAEESKDPAAPVNRLDKPSTSFGRSKGVFFLVDAKARQVVWSTFEAAQRFDSSHLDRTASDIVSRLKRDLKQEQAAGPKPAPANPKPQPSQPKETEPKSR
jgi:hypothetical protein